MNHKIKRACDYLDYIIVQLTLNNIDILYECKDVISTIFFHGDKLDSVYLDAIPVDKISDVSTFLTRVRYNQIEFYDDELVKVYIKKFTEVSQILKIYMHKRGGNILYNKRPNIKKYDVFISHANVDKLHYVDSLYNAINKLGIDIFYDKEEISWGDNWKDRILKGTKNSEFAIIVISKNYFGREWTEKELVEFLNRQNESGQKIILPLLYEIDFDEFLKLYPQLSEIQTLKVYDNSTNNIAILLAKELIKRYKEY